MPLRFPLDQNPTPALAAAVTERIWSRVTLQWDWLGGAMPEREIVATPAGAHAA